MGRAAKSIFSAPVKLIKSAVKLPKKIISTGMGLVGGKRKKQSETRAEAMQTVSQAAGPILGSRTRALPSQNLAGSQTVMTSALGVLEEARTRRSTLGG